MARMTGRHAILAMLRAEGIDEIFGTPGSTELPLLDALERYPDLSYRLALQETVTLGMADGYARARRRPAFALLHIDSGLGNAMGLFTTVSAAGTPLVVAAVNKDVRKLTEGRADLAELVRQYTKFSAEVTHVEQIPGVLRRAFCAARSPASGPTFVSFAANVLDAEADLDIAPTRHDSSRAHPDPDSLRLAAEHLCGARAPLILVGDRVGQSDAVSEALALAEVLGANVFATDSGEINFPPDSPLFLGGLGQLNPTTRRALADYDVILAVGTSVFGGTMYFPGPALARGTKLLHLDSAVTELGKSELTDVAVLSDPKVGLRELRRAVLAELSPPALSAARQRCERASATRADRIRRDVSSPTQGGSLSPRRMLTELASRLPSDTVIVDDAGTASGLLVEALQPAPARYVGWAGGAIGWGMGAALGVKLARRAQPVVALVGDGSAMMSIQALWTAAASSLHVIYVICNNASYRVLKRNMQSYQRDVLGRQPESRNIGLDISPAVDFAALGAALGLKTWRVDSVEALHTSVEEALAAKSACVIDVTLDGRL